MNESISIAAIVATVISLLLEWFPGLAGAWDKLTAMQKQGIMAAAVAIISVVVVAGNCYWWGDTCPADWAVFLRDTLLTFIAAAAANQGVHLLTRRPTA